LLKRYAGDETFTSGEKALVPLVNPKIFRKVSATGPYAAEVVSELEEIAKAHGLKLKIPVEAAHYSLQSGVPPVAVPIAAPIMPLNLQASNPEKGRVLFSNAMGVVPPVQHQPYPQQQQQFEQVRNSTDMLILEVNGS
jgi:hypothetical protein